jgi:hypothetical protein
VVALRAQSTAHSRHSCCQWPGGASRGPAAGAGWGARAGRRGGILLRLRNIMYVHHNFIISL